ncbi:peptidase M20 family protein [Halobacterium hubeiense]|uniref:Peptidase M20 family protein n=1 Tax=Halobacterium hubeiense TaxID=1407499 RepID=A0A0U5GX38_9EURY|nr:M20/M25/M40 family metallo-hydrolase [Halobacterium hubeiense]CQH44163.1 peptidase M20 family protein [Halobacterium hubeiense]
MTSAREFVTELVSFASTDGGEAPVSSWFSSRLAELGFETYEWDVDADLLAGHRSFPDDPDAIRAADRRSVGGVLELGDPDAGPTLVLNGHFDVVPADEAVWSSQPFEARWRGDELTARGAADMKSGLAACVFAALALAERDVDGRVVVEGVVGEEAGGVGAATAALDNPYPFERDAAIIAEPTALTPVVASEGSLMKRLRLTGRSSHAATPWRGESVLPHFDSIREAFADLAGEREQTVTHPLYEEFPTKWPVVCGTVEAGEWASTVPASLVAEWRIGVAPGETVAEVEEAFDQRLADVVAESEWLAEHPPEFERFSVQFEASEISPDEPVVRAVQSGMHANDLAETEPRGVTYGADARHYMEAGIPTVMFGPGSIEQAHFPDETIDFREVETAVDVLADAGEAFLAEN